MFTRSLLVIALVAASGVAMAQTTPDANKPSTATPPGGATMPRDNSTTNTGTPPAQQNQASPTSPLATEALAKEKIQGAGYTGVKELMKNPDGTWSAKAMKDDKEIAVSVDAEGNVMTR